MSSEGCREIEAARQRLAAAKTQASSVSKNMQSAREIEQLAKKNREAIQLQLETSREEVEMAETFLKEAEKRWGVIDVDSSGGSVKDIGNHSNKRRITSSLHDSSHGVPCSANEASFNYPDLEKWNPVSTRNITLVAASVLSKLKDLDHLDLFSRPVCEECPYLADEYLRQVHNPMDFRTIGYERLPAYDHITELQEDLILVFRNCCVYDGGKSHFSSYALDIWKSLNDVFYDVCKEKQIITLSPIDSDETEELNNVFYSFCNKKGIRSFSPK